MSEELKKDESPKKENFLSKITDKLKRIKHLDIILTVLFIAIILLIYFSTTGLFSSKGRETSKQTTENISSSSSEILTMDTYVSALSSNLETLICGLSGVSSVKVMLYYDEDISYDIAYTQETKTTSDGAKIDTKSPVLIDVDGTKKPIILSKNLPKPKSIVVVAGGAKNTSVKLEILRLIQAMFEISSSKIEIFAGK